MIISAIPVYIFRFGNLLNDLTDLLNHIFCSLISNFYYKNSNPHFLAHNIKKQSLIYGFKLMIANDYIYH